ncbi:hypothetical protein Bca4012_041290 [Brassica carinata]
MADTSAEVPIPPDHEARQQSSECQMHRRSQEPEAPSKRTRATRAKGNRPPKVRRRKGIQPWMEFRRKAPA